MSIQLIIFPQNYNGQFNAISSDPNEFVVNGINFNGLDSAPSYDVTSTPVPDVLLANAPPLVINSWYRFRTADSGTPALPATNGGVVLSSVVGTVSTGIYQRLSNLTIGQNYTVTVNISNTGLGSGLISLKAYNETTLINGELLASTSSSITLNFFAQTTTDTILFFFTSTVVDSITVSSITALALGVTPSTDSNILDNGQVIVDLYEDEDIPLTLSVDDFKNVAEKVQSYSKAFNLPATKRNNKIFDNIFDITRTDDGIVFNPYMKTQSILKQDGFILFEGYLRLIDIQDKEGEISYNVNLYSEVIALADLLEERTFSNLSFTELSHSYDKDQIKNSWNDSGGTGISYTNPSTSGFRDANDTLKYPFIDWNHDFSVANGSTGSNATLNMPELTSLEQAFRPTIQLKYLIQRIFQDTPFTFTSAFFDTTDFEKLYMDFNWGSESTIIEGQGTLENNPFNTSLTTYKPLELDTTDFPDEFGYDSANFNFVAANDGTSYTFDYAFTVYMTVAADLSFRWFKKNAAGNITEIKDASLVLGSGLNPPQYIDRVGSFTITLNQNETIGAYFKTASAAAGAQGVLSFNYSTYVNATVGVKLVTSDVLLQTLRGELGQWQFLKGIMNMFNLVSIPDKSNPNNILIEPYADVFINNTNCSSTGEVSLACRSIAHDWTEKIDISEIKLTPLTELNKKTIFKFVEDDDDYAFMNYKNSVGGHLYGSKIYDASGFTILTGEKEIIAEPFAATLSKMLMTQFAEFVTPAIYSYNADDGTSEGFDNSPRILYNNGKVTMANSSYYIPAHNGLSSENQSIYLQFSHLSDVPTISGTRDFNYGECQLMTGLGNSVPNNLFNLYWLPYYSELYNPDTRTMVLKVNLTPSDLNTLNMYDTIFIKNREFRINKIDYKPNDLATVEFILIP